jgi:hypothetical protein
MRDSNCKTMLTALAIVLLFGCGRGPKAPEGRPFHAFVSDLTDLPRLSRLSTPDTRLISTYDRTGGNDDNNFFLRASKDPGWQVVAEAQGPGVVRRFWTTGMDPGHPIRIYFDGEKEPRISGPVESLFGEEDPFTPPLARYLNLCFSSYVPLPFNESIRIETLAPNNHPPWGLRRLYFQLNIDRDMDGPVQTYPRTFSDDDRRALEQVRHAWGESVEWPVPDWTGVEAQVLPSGAAASVWTKKGPGTVASWSVHVEPADPDAWNARDLEHLVRDLVLRVTYDGLDAPSIDVPLGHFFCNAWRERHFGCLLLGASPQGYTCRMPMPFRDRIEVALHNGSDHEVSVRFHADVVDRCEPDDGYLHAAWSRSPPEKGVPHDVAHFTGRGKLVGCFLGVTGHDNSYWILEGDETLRIDGEVSPSWHGTGLEDYFNGGWYYRNGAFAPLHGIMDRAPFRTAQYRFHLVDAPRFETSLKMQFEKGHANESRGVLQSTAYAYLASPGGVPACPDDRASRRMTPHPLERHTVMLQLVELERMNNFTMARRFCDEYVETYPGAPENGLLKLRALEYRRYLGEVVDPSPFLQGEHGPEAAEQAKRLEWLYAEPGRAIVGLCVNGKGRAYLDGRAILRGDHPQALVTTGVDIGPGPHLLAAEVEVSRAGPALQLGIRMHGGVRGTGPPSRSTQTPAAGWQQVDFDDAGWNWTGSRYMRRGPPDDSYPGSVPNAYILLQSKTYSILYLDWDAHRQPMYFRIPFDVPIEGLPDSAPQMTGLVR